MAFVVTCARCVQRDRESLFLISGYVRQGNIFSFGNVNVFPDLDVIALAFGTVMCL